MAICTSKLEGLEAIQNKQVEKNNGGARREESERRVVTGSRFTIKLKMKENARVHVLRKQTQKSATSTAVM